MFSKKLLHKAIKRAFLSRCLLPGIALFLLSFCSVGVFLYRSFGEAAVFQKSDCSSSSSVPQPFQAENHNDQASYLSIRQMFTCPANKNSRSDILNDINGDQPPYTAFQASDKLCSVWEFNLRQSSVFLREIHRNSVSERAGPTAA